MFIQLQEFPPWEINESGVIRHINTGKLKYVREHKSGYLVTQFGVNGKTRTIKIHRLVAETFLPPPDESLVIACKGKFPYKVCINHKDLDKTNNHVSNLEWCDIYYNNNHARENGAVPSLEGSLNGRAKLTESLVHQICKDFECGMQPKDAIVKYNISHQQATKIRAGIQWKHVSSQYNIVVNRRQKRSTTIESTED